MIIFNGNRQIIKRIILEWRIKSDSCHGSDSPLTGTGIISFNFSLFLFIILLFIYKTQCYGWKFWKDLWSTKRKKGTFLSEHKFKTPNSLKFHIVFPHSKSISSKLEAMRDMSFLLEYLADHRLSSSFHVSWFSFRELWAIPTVITKMDFESASEALPTASLRKTEYIFIKMSWLNKGK